MSSVIVYVGDDPDLARLLDALCARRGGWSLRTVSPSADTFSELLALVDLKLVVYDFTVQAVVTDAFCQQLLIFRTLVPSRYVPVVGLFSSTAQRDELSHLFTLGLSYAHIKGADTAVFEADCTWLVTNRDETLGEFATARNLDLDYHCEALAALVELGSDQLVLDTDVVSDFQGLSAQAFGEQSPLQIEVLDVQEHGQLNDTFHSAKCFLHYPGPWDEVQETTLQQDTLETYVSQLPPVHMAPVVVYTNNRSLQQAIVGSPVVESFRIFCVNDAVQFAGVVAALVPSLVLVDLASDAEEEKLLQALRETQLKRPEWAPHLLLSGGSLTTDMAKIQLSTDRVLATTKRLDARTLREILVVKAKKLTFDDDALVRGFQLSDPSRLVSFRLPVRIRSLSEHEVNFYCQAEIPMFTVLRFTAPVVFYVLLVPTARPSVSERWGTHYRALIHGLDHEDEVLLRSYVNSIIFTPPKAFGILSKHEAPQCLPAKDAGTMTEAPPTESAVVHELPTVGRVRTGKSKL